MLSLAAVRYLIVGGIAVNAHGCLRHTKDVDLVIPAAPPPPLEPELASYGLLRAEGGDAYRRYNSWLRRLTSLEKALSRRTRALGHPS